MRWDSHCLKYNYYVNILIKENLFLIIINNQSETNEINLLIVDFYYKCDKNFNWYDERMWWSLILFLSEGYFNKMIWVSE